MYYPPPPKKKHKTTTGSVGIFPEKVEPNLSSGYWEFTKNKRKIFLGGFDFLFFGGLVVSHPPRK